MSYEGYIDKIVLVECDDMVSPEQRVLTMNVNNDMINQLADLYGVDAKVSRRAVARTIGRGMGLSENSFKPRIYRGKGKEESIELRRFRFYAHIVLQECDIRSPGSEYIISGFTGEIYDSDLSDLDEDAELFINQIVEYRTVMRQGRRGDYVDYAINKMILINRKDRSHEDGRRNRLHTATIADVLTLTGLAHNNELDLDEDDGELITSRSAFRRTAKTTNNRELSRSTYLHGLLNADRQGVASRREQSTGWEDDDTGSGRYMYAAQEVAVSYTLDHASPVLNVLRSFNREATQSATIHYGDLANLVDGSHQDYQALCDVTKIIPIKDNDLDYYSQKFYGKSKKMQAVAIACQEIPTIMSDCNLASVNFTINNDTLHDDMPEHSINDFETIIPIENGGEDMAKLFIDRVVEEVYNSVTQGNRIFLDLHVKVRFGGLLEIVIQYDRGDDEEFKFPCFMSALFASNSSYELDKTKRLAGNYHKLSRDFVDRVVYDKETDDTAPARRTNRSVGWDE